MNTAAFEWVAFIERLSYVQNVLSIGASTASTCTLVCDLVEEWLSTVCAEGQAMFGSITRDTAHRDRAGLQPCASHDTYR